MPTRVHYADTGREVEHLVNRLAANGEEVTAIENLGHKWLVLSVRPAPRLETRVEQPDTRGDASREVRG